MNLKDAKLVTIVAERLLKSEIIEKLKEAGIKGYTLTDAGGEGSRGIRATEWEGRNLKIECIVSESLAEKITDIISAEYFQHYAVIVYVQSVGVVRGDKYI